jgi:hypothetical protein
MCIFSVILCFAVVITRHVICFVCDKDQPHTEIRWLNMNIISVRGELLIL